MSPVTAPLSQGGTGGGGFPGLNPANTFKYSTRATGLPASGLSLGTVAGVGKAFGAGGKLVMGFANQVVFNFIGKNAAQPSVQSSLPLSFVQPFLAGGGRAVTLEPLTQADATSSTSSVSSPCSASSSPWHCWSVGRLRTSGRPSRALLSRAAETTTQPPASSMSSKTCSSWRTTAATSRLSPGCT